MKKYIPLLIGLGIVIVGFWILLPNPTDTADLQHQNETAAETEKERTTGFIEKNGATYYYDDDETLRIGWATIDGDRYYFKQTGDASVKGKMFVGKLPIQGKQYYFDQEGRLQTGWIEYQEDCYYYALDDGSLVSGLQYIEEQFYWFADDCELWGNLKSMSEGEVGLVKEALKSWDDSVTRERWQVIARGLSLIGKVTYTQKERNTPSAEEPEFLDCSSFVANCFYYGGGCQDVEPRFCTDHFLYQNQFVTIKKEELIPGDIFITFAEGHWQTGNHIGIYIGKLPTGEQIFMHCAGDVTEQNNPVNRGIWITIRDEDEMFRRYHGFM